MIYRQTNSLSISNIYYQSAMMVHQAYKIYTALHNFFANLVLVSSFHKTEDEIKAEYEVVQKAKENPQFFAPLYERYYDSIFIYINRRVDDEEITADLTAQVFYKCLKNLPQYEFQGLPFSAWLFKITLNEINQFFKNQQHKERAVSLKEKHVNIIFEEIQHHDTKDKNEVVKKLLESLEPEDVQFLELRFFEDRSFKEIGFLLGLTEGNAKIKTYRILDKLKILAEKLLR